MSAEAMAYAFKHSPYPGASAPHAALLAIADTVSDVHGNRFFMSLGELAKKARVSDRRIGKAVETLAADGWLEEVRPATFTDPAEYEFLMPADRAVQWEPRRVREAREAREQAATTDGASPDDTTSRPDDTAPPVATSGPDVTTGPDAASGVDATSGPDTTASGDPTPRRGGPDATSGGTRRSVTRTQENPNQPNGEPNLSSPPGADDPPGIDVRDVDGSFDAFWDAFPRHAINGKPGGGGARKAARRRWKAMTLTQRRAALAALPHYAADLELQTRRTGDKAYPCHASTWLNQDRWEQHQDPPADHSDPTRPTTDRDDRDAWAHGWSGRLADDTDDAGAA